MTTKLVSANMGIVLIVERDGQQERYDFSITCPRGEEQPIEAIYALKRFVDDVFGYSVEHKEVPLAKPKSKAKHRVVSQDEFNKRIKELQP